LGEENIKNMLKSLGISEKESQVYIFLAKHGIFKSREIAKYTKTNNAEIYRILKNLQIKGLIEPTLESPTRFTIVPFEKILDSNIKAKQEEAAKIESAKKELLAYWKNIEQTKIETSIEKFMVIEGNNKVNSKISEMIKETKNRVSIISTVTNLLKVNQFGIFDIASKQSSKSNIKLRFLTEISAENLGLMKSFLKEITKAKLVFEGKNPELGLRLTPQIVVKDQDEVLFFIANKTNNSTGQPDLCIWTNSKALVQSFSMIFEDLWINALDVKQKIFDIENGNTSQKAQIISNSEEAGKKYEEMLNSASNEIIILTSSSGLIDQWKKSVRLIEWKQKGILVKLMAPITNDNIEAAKGLSKICAVKHVIFSYLMTTIVDSKLLFQVKTQPINVDNFGRDPDFDGAFYTDDIQQVERAKIILSNIWQAATPLEPDIPKSLRNSSTPISSIAVKKFDQIMKSSPPESLPKGYAICGIAFIHPPSHLNLSSFAIRIYSYEEKSSFGAGNTIDIRMQLKTSKGYDLVPVAAANTNPKAAIPEKAFFAGSPASENYLVVRPEELHVRRQGNTIFGGWTFPMPLPPTQHSLPPAAILIEGYGQPRHSKVVWPTPSGYSIISEFDAYDAFVTFIDPLWKYAGPGTQGQVCFNSIMTTIKL
jgi:sugar-specific transcriptional regulator TrmB